jgi:anthranilate phosphoribosyltransferase
MILSNLLRTLGTSRRDGRNLTHDESYRAFSAIFEGSESDVAIAAFLTAMRWKGVTIEELIGFAQGARDKARIPCQGMEGIVTVCPPHDGSDTVPPLEVASCLIAAGAGARVLLITDQGLPPRRGVTGACALQELGGGLTWDPTEAEDWVCKSRFAAIAAPGMLPGLMNLRQVRGELGVRTPLFTVEKLLAPSSSAVVIGAQEGAVLGTAVEVMVGLGHPRGIAIQGIEGGVLPSVRRRTRGIELTDSSQVPLTVEPADFGLSWSAEPDLPMYGPPDEGRGSGDNPLLIKAAGDIVLKVLAGVEGAARNAAILGAAVIIKASGRVPTLAEGVDCAIISLDSGEAHHIFRRVSELGK